MNDSSLSSVNGDGLIDPVERLEADIAHLFRELRDGNDDDRSTAFGALLRRVLAERSSEDRRRILERLRLRNPTWLALEENQTNGPAVDAKVKSTEGAADRGRATLQRQCHELTALNHELEGRLEESREKNEEVENELQARSRAFRQLEKSCEALRDRVQTLVKSSERAEAQNSMLRLQLQTRVDECTRQAAKILELDTKIRTVVGKSQPTAGPAVASVGSEPAPSTIAQPRPDENNKPMPVAPPKSAPQAFHVFLSRLQASGPLPPDDGKVPIAEREIRLGEVSAILVRFLDQLERQVLAHLDTFGQKDAAAAELSEGLRVLRLGEPSWWQALTQRKSVQADPVGEFEIFVTEVAWLAGHLFTSYYHALGKMREHAKHLLDPAGIRRAADSTRDDEAWAHFENQIAPRIPDQLFKKCERELITVLRELYHSR